MTEVNLICCTFYNIFHEKSNEIKFSMLCRKCPYTGKFLVQKALINTADGTLLQEDVLKPKFIFCDVDLKRH